MGTLTPAISALTSFTGTGVAGAAPRLLAMDDILRGAMGVNDQQRTVDQHNEQQDLALQQLQQRQDTQMRDLQEQAALDRTKIATDTATADTARRASLKRAVARQRASFGASGVGNQGSGSSEAVLLGLFSESDEERASREKLDNLRFSAMDQDLAAQNRVNVLELSQLAERQRIDRASNWF